MTNGTNFLPQVFNTQKDQVPLFQIKIPLTWFQNMMKQRLRKEISQI